MARQTTLEIDPNKFEKVILERFGSMNRASIESGHMGNYCSDIRRNRSITKAFMRFLNDRGIHYDDIKPDPEPEEPEPDESPLDQTVTITLQNLAEALTVAIYTAMMNLHRDGVI